VVSVAAVELRSGRRFERNAHAVLPAASTIKVLVSAALWTAIERGEIDPGTRMPVAQTPAPGGGGLVESMHPETALCLADLDLLMLAVSDNAATNVIIDAVGMEAVNALAAALELSHTRLRRRMMDVSAVARGEENTTCAADMVALLEALARADAVPSRACRRVLAGLAQTQHTDIAARYLPVARQRVVASKQGELAGVRHDVALIDEGERRVALAVLSAPAAAAEGLAHTAALAYRRVTVRDRRAGSRSTPRAT
jgi:beta-lactamase class A